MMHERLRALFYSDSKELDQDHFSALKNAFNTIDMPKSFYENRGDSWYEFIIVWLQRFHPILQN